jgi:hypothetical protein
MHDRFLSEFYQFLIFSISLSLVNIVIYYHCIFFLVSILSVHLPRGNVFSTKFGSDLGAYFKTRSVHIRIGHT